jgi:hypothetical protein
VQPLQLSAATEVGKIFVNLNSQNVHALKVRSRPPKERGRADLHYELIHMVISNGMFGALL